ncbi:type II secretion system F family protein [Candidatus Margulisiibacteriota bacterium]
MPKFRYLARSLTTGQNTQGVLEASSQEMLLDRLYFKGLQAVEVNIVEKNFSEKVTDFFSRVGPEVLIVFVRQLGTLIRSGIPLFKAMQIVIDQTEDVRFKKILTNIKADLAEGSSLAKAMANFPHIFSSFFINMVAVGENRGQLDEAFERILLFEEKTREIRNKVVSALTYPLLLLISGAGVLAALIIFVLPKFVQIFQQSNIELPILTRVLVKFSNVLQSHFGWIFGAILGMTIGTWIFFQTKEGQHSKDFLKFKLPIFGPVIHHAAISRFARTLGTLHHSGVPLIRALELSKDSVNNIIIAEALDKVIASVQDGKGISEPLGQIKIFPQIMVHMIGVGEESGSLDEMALKTADFYDQETDYKIKRQMALLEPLALVFIAIIVAFIAASILLPMFKMAGSLRRL